MGVCESENISPNLIRIDDEIKDISKEYLLDNSIHEKIKNKYKLKNKIGEGSFGKVFIGLNKSGQKYAVKCIKKKKIVQGPSISNEIKMGIKFNHPNILGIREVYEDMKKISYVMEYCEGGDLLDYIMKSPQGKLDEKTSLNIIIQILDALNYLHNEVKVCHRDLKPENCLIAINGKKEPSVKIIDFGTADFINKEKKLTGKIGSLKYMAPEIFNKPFYNEKVDLWSAGAILYNMVTGCESFIFDLKEFKKNHILKGIVNFDIVKNDDIRELCQGLLEKNPHKRLDAKTALEMAKSIRQKLFRNFNEQ